MAKMLERVRQVAFHRNGIGGLGFHAVLFEMKPDDAPTRELFLGIVFDAPAAVAVLSLKRAVGDVGVAFGPNSWRGDQFEAELRAVIATHESDGSVRVGPFALPTVPRGPTND